MEALVIIYARKNNLFLSLTDLEGNLLVYVSAGCVGFRNARKSTPYAAHCVAIEFLNRIKKFNITFLHFKLVGLGPGREPSIRRLLKSNFKILTFIDETPLIFNGCRQPKKRKL